MIENLLVLVILVAGFYMVAILPQQRKIKKHTAFVNSLKEGDEILTIGGIAGRINGFDGDLAKIEVAPGIEISLIKTAIARNYPDDAKEALSDAQ